jgi:hypothetical protein
MKGVQSKEKLACKATLLNVALNKETTRIKALPTVLETNPMNISFVVQRRHNIKLSSSSQWALLTRRQQSDVIDAKVVSCVLEWYNNETRVNLNKSNIMKKRIAPKVYEKHATHLLLET